MSDNSIREEAIEAANQQKGAIDDTAILKAVGKRLVLEPDKTVSGNTNKVTVMKGSKFFIPNMVKKSAVVTSAAVKVNAKGMVTAKNDTGDTAIRIAYKIEGSSEEHNLLVEVIEPRLISDGKTIVNKMKATARTGDAFDITMDIPLGLTLMSTKNSKSAVADLVLQIGDDGRYHIKGIASSKGSARMHFVVNNKKTVVRLLVK